MGQQVDEAAVSELRQRVRGPVIQPWDAAYGEARKVYNAQHDRYPALIVQAEEVADVVAAVRFAADQGLLLAVRGGGHSLAGFSTCDGGLVLDLGRMRRIVVDAERGLIRVQGGCTWAEVNDAAHAYGLATPGGVVSSTGVAGLTLGGGFGLLMRRYGLSCDNLVSADVVTADGTALTCDAEREPDLFWALRGGGGNVGVVTAFEFRAHPVGEILGGLVAFPLEADALRAYRDQIADAPEELTAIAAVAGAPAAPFVEPDWHGRPVIVLIACWTGDEERGRKVIDAFTGRAPVVGRMIERMPYPVINTFFDEELPPGLHHYWKGHFVRGLPDGAIDVHLEHGAKLPSPESGTLLFPLGGAAGRVGSADTAFAYRDADFAVGLGASWHGSADTAANVAWCRRYSADLARFDEGGGYVNFGSDDDADRVVANYGGNYARLAAIKRRYDPGNLFRLNQNVRPAS